ncbi:MAG TPA: hypothetical protein VEI97_18305 [bacterium]|nr:hypothetical protein [bacterium]
MGTMLRYRVQILIDCRTIPRELRVMDLEAASPAMALRRALCDINDRAIYFPSLRNDIVVIPAIQLAYYCTDGYPGNHLAMLAAPEGSSDALNLVELAEGTLESLLSVLPLGRRFHREALDASFCDEFKGWADARLAEA